MTLKFQENIDKIKGCPAENEKGEKMLFRCVESKITEKSFIPHAVLSKPKYQDKCIAWGLSVFSSFGSANQMLKNLSKNKRISYSKIARGRINDQHGIKYCSKNKEHYTFFPSIEFDVVENFQIISQND